MTYQVTYSVVVVRWLGAEVSRVFRHCVDTATVATSGRGKAPRSYLDPAHHRLLYGCLSPESKGRLITRV